MRRKHDNGYFHFTRKERNGIIVLLCIIILLICLPYFYPLLPNHKKVKDNRYAADIATLEAMRADSSKRFQPYKEKFREGSRFSYNPSNISAGTLFYFDPNVISAEDWKRLGVKDKTIVTIQNYLSKGGRFRQPDDIKKIWGLSFVADRLMPYVKIREQTTADGNMPKRDYKSAYTKKAYEPIDVNDADSTTFTRLPGIGAGLSRRIIKYREKLGGFYSADQVAETFGLPDSTYHKIRPSLNIGSHAIKKININIATADELKAHPYIRYLLAKVIVEYRNQHGVYTSPSDIKHIMLVNDSIYKKLSPYLSVE